MSYGNGIKLTTGFDVGAKSPLDNKSVVETIDERDAFVTDNLAYEGLEVYVKETKTKYRYNGTSWIDLDTQSGSGSGTGEGLTTEQAQQLTTAYEHSQTPHVSADDIPTNISDLTNDSGFITSIPEEYITETELENKGYLTSHQDISGLQTKTDDSLTTTDKTVIGAINEVKLSIPTRTSELENNSNFITNDDLPTVPTKVSDLENDRGYLISIPEEYITETELEAKGYLTSHQDISNLQSKIDNNLATTSKEVVGAINEVKSSVDGITVPTKTSDLTNDSGFITSIPSEYITETELETKGYLTEHQSLTDYAKKTDIPDVSSFITSDDLPTVPTKVSELTNDSNFITSIPEEYITETELKSNYYTKEEVGELLEEGGSGVYSTTTPVNNPIGGIKRGDEFTNKPISEIIDLMLHVVERVKVALSSSVSGGIREIGDTSISTSTFTINVTKGTNPVVAVKLFKDNVEVQDFADVENGGSFTYDGGAITTDTKFVAKANDGDGDIASTAISYKFVSPMYIGSSDNGLEAFSETDATSLTKKIVDKNTKTIQAFTHTQQHMCFVVPNTWNGSPTIKDQNNFDITTAFNSKAIQVTGLDGVARDYIAFVSNDKSTLSDYSITITF